MSWGSSVGLWSQVSASSRLQHPQDPRPTPGTADHGPSAPPGCPAHPCSSEVSDCSSYQTATCYMETTGTAGFTGPWTPALVLPSSWSSPASWGLC